MKPFTFEDISEMPDEKVLPMLDQDFPEVPLDPILRCWRDFGVVELHKFIPENLIQAYCNRWVLDNLDPRKVERPRFSGFPEETAYMTRPEVRNLGLYPPLMEILRRLIGDDMGMHLNLTGWKSTQRNWHQDDYLNPPFIYCWYAAVWIALDDISPDAGPFEYVPGSHRWPLTRRDKLFKFIPEEMQKDPRWPALTQEEVSEAFEKKIAETGIVPVKFIPKRGDVLIWHGRLAHRGTVPNDPNLLRKAFISHYSALSKRVDMPKRAEHTPGCWYFVL